MYAIVDIAGQQFKVEKERKLYVHRLKAEEGATITFDKVLLVDNEGTVKVGAPYIDGASVTAKVLTHLKGEKVIVFKKKRRKGYQNKIFRLWLTRKVSVVRRTDANHTVND